MSKPRKFQHDRKLVNYLLQPFLQLRIGVYSVGLGIVFCAIIATYLFFKLNQFADVVVALTESNDAIRELISGYLSSTAVFALGLGVLFIVANFAITIYFTHKMVGPTVAFRRHLKQLTDGRYNTRVVLRKGDAFEEVASDLNALAATLEQKHGPDGKSQKAG